jgi:integrase
MPYHTLRKSCIRDWAGKFSAHVVEEWAGHSDLNATDRYYLQVPESKYSRAADYSFWQEQVQITQNVTQKADFAQNQPFV